MEPSKRKAESRKPPKGGFKKSRTRGSRDGGKSFDGTDTTDQFEDKWKRGVDEVVDSRLWVQKHSPVSEKDLAVHKRKVAEVREWIEEQVQDPPESHSRVLVLTGPAGVGKTAVVLTLAKSMDLELLEWTTPTPTLWNEFSHHAATGAPYMSKIDEFEVFIEKARKFVSLPTSSLSSSIRPQTKSSGLTKLGASKKRTKLLLIDDLPNVHDKAHRQRLSRTLHGLAVSSRFPTVVVITDAIGIAEYQEDRKVVTSEIIQALERGGAKKVAFNPITVNAILKVLKKVQLIEKSKAPLESLTSIAENCLGDIRQALASLQFLCLGLDSRAPRSSNWDPGGGDAWSFETKLPSNDCKALTQSNVPETPTLGDRDLSLSLFHALGKILHNKRFNDVLAPTNDCEKLRLKEEYRRNPLKMAEPEVVLSQAYAETATVAAFLQENVLQFVDEEATDDVASISSYLSDADCLLGGEGSMRSRRGALNFSDVEPSQVAYAAASSVAARGVLFSNVHPAPPRWQSLRAPFLWQVERQRNRKKIEISSDALSGMFPTIHVSSSVLATEVYPYIQKLPRQSSSIWHATEIYEHICAEPLIPDEDEMELDTMADDAKPVKQNSFVLESIDSEMDIEDEIEEW
ncbi:cell cycle checkpoint protein [Marchantia polymorpha subsp. ruderalis]|uniref:AAA+ ATPase domain-containing protein n=2 Tax=Marchantia polymorpha TaxID=3197 RepID=A0AAF6B0T3_MARPO|nr:hypothetical protein MARPO_0004s0213 [Marchantia polymorpha]BBN05617.1 hypothetical protein Mp_3g14580 [Marchantia polymorpha subsp. ruderalis]|eukprot:PTQ48964.1 hypothetical protein MARPO_0004s0213 [Marchantia polymorpha]